jgi:hypothetical protein
LKNEAKEIAVRFYHGSRRKWKYRNEPKELGGKFGGHVVIQIDDFVYGFIYRDIKKIHIFPRKNKKNCVFQKQSLEEWLRSVQEKRVTNIFIPVAIADKKFLIDYFEENIVNASCDYSFFGERCASNCYHLLKQIGKIDGGSYLFNAFYPARFRRKLLKSAKEKGYRIEQFKGSEKRKWEGESLV